MTIYNKFNKSDYKFIIGISFALGLRQLAMLLVMPIISIYAQQLKGSTPALVGVAVGIFGLTQASFQIPYGILSEKSGRKRYIIQGLVFLIIGLVVAGLSDNIYLLIIGRALQGTGGIQAVAYAWIGDSISDNKRSHAMSILGIVVGGSAVIGFLIGPLISNIVSVPILFDLCAVVVGITCLYIILFLKEDKQTKYDPQAGKKTMIALKNIIKCKRVMALDIAGFLMNYTMIATFYIMPLKLVKHIGEGGLWKVFVPATIIGIVIMRLMVHYADKNQFRIMGILAFVFSILSAICMLSNKLVLLIVSMILFMMEYMYLSTILPSSVTKKSKQWNMGIATGSFNTLQFFGTFVGGSMTGFLWGMNNNAPIIAILIVSIFGLGIMFEFKE